MDLSVMFFGADDGASDHVTAYQDVLDIAREADELGYAAVWVPERHFQSVGRIFPNPVVLGAALAAVTRRIGIRAGSVVVPLHHPVRIAEDWAVVDNISRGRVGLCAATGWHSTDFVLAPERYEDRRAYTTETIGLLRRLWAGEGIELPDGTGKPVTVCPQPRPVSTGLPLWMVSSGSTATWETAGRLRTGVLAATTGETPQSLAEKIGLYREAYAAAPPQPNTPERGTVTLMAHAHVGTDAAEARRRASAPLRSYLRSHVLQMGSSRSADGVRRSGMTEDEIAVMTEFAMRRYLNWGALVGSPETCRDFLAELRALGCDEVACFVDFGLPRQDILSSLRLLAEIGKEAS